MIKEKVSSKVVGGGGKLERVGPRTLIIYWLRRSLERDYVVHSGGGRG